MPGRIAVLLLAFFIVSVLAAWLLLSGQAATVEDAVAQIRRARPRIVLKAEQLAVLAQVAGQPQLSREVSHVG